MTEHHSKPEFSPRSGWILYDASCGFCSKLVSRWEPLLVKYGYGIAPLQDNWVAEEFKVSSEELIKDIRLILPDGQKRQGADVYRSVMKKIWWLTPLYIISIIPGFNLVFDLSYRTVNKNRHRISNACGLPSKR